MRKFIHLVSIGLCILLLPACSEEKFSSWSRYTSQSGAFSIEMPPHPKTVDKTEATVFGKQVVHYVTWKPGTFALDKFKMFQVSYTDCPQRFTSDSTTLNAALDSSINHRKTDFTEIDDIVSQPIQLNGYKGRTFIYSREGDNTVTIVKEYIIQNKKYDLTAIVKKNYNTSAEINTFFNSFQVLR